MDAILTGSNAIYPLTTLASSPVEHQWQGDRLLIASHFAEGQQYTYKGATIRNPVDAQRELKRTQLIQSIRQTATATRAALVADYDAIERASWPDKITLAKQVHAGDTTAAATLSIECNSRGDGTTPAELAAIILTNAKKLLPAELYIRGVQSRLEKACENATNSEQLNAVEQQLPQAFDLSALS